MVGNQKPTPRRGRQRLVVGSIVALGSLVVTLVLAEIGVPLFAAHPYGPEGELTGMYSNDGQRSFRLTPGFRGQITVADRSLPIELNRLGMRSPELQPRRASELRVLCLGDSFVFGYGVRGEEAFPSLLRDQLADRLERQVVTGNAGVPGHGTVDMTGILAHQRNAFDADVVVASIYLGNDFEDDFVLTKIMVQGHFMVGQPQMPGEWARMFQTTWRGRLAMRSRLALYIEQWLLGNAPSLALQPTPTAEELTAFAGFPPPNQRFAGLFMDAVNDKLFRDEATGRAGIPRIFARVRESLTRIRELSGDSPVVVLIFPTSYHVEEELWEGRLEELGLDPAEFRMGMVQRRLGELCAELGLPVLDFTPLFRALADPQSVFLPVNKHFNTVGHRMVAEHLAVEIVELLSRD